MSYFNFSGDSLAQVIINHVPLIPYVEQCNPDGFKYDRFKNEARSCRFYPDTGNNPTGVVYGYDKDKKLWHDFTQGEINNKSGLNVIDFEALFNCDGNYSQAYKNLLNQYPEIKKVINQGQAINDKNDSDRFSNTLNEDACNLELNQDILKRECLDRGLSRKYVKDMKIGFFIDNYGTSWLTIPYYDFSFNHIYCRKRNLDYYTINGSVNKNNTKPKYMVDKFRSLEAPYEPLWGLHTLGRKQNKTLYITEGMFDSMIMDSLGYSVLTSNNCTIDNYQLEELIEIIKFYKNFENITIILDNDEAGITGARKYVNKLLEYKINRNISVVLIPETDSKGHVIKDIADYYKFNKANDPNLINLLSSNRFDALSFLAYTELKSNPDAVYEIKKVIRNNNRWIAPEKITKLIADLKLWVSTDDTIPLTEADIKELEVVNKAPSEDILFNEMLSQYDLIYSNSNGFYKFKEGYFKNVPDNEVKKDIMKLQGRFKRDTVKKAVYNHLADYCNDEAEYLNRNFDNPGPNLVTFNNGTLNMDTDEFTENFDRYNYQTFKLDFDYNPDAECPNYDNFVNDVMGEDQGKIDLLNEAGGYIFKRDTKMQKCFWFVGNGSNGKSTFFDLMKILLGKNNWSSVLPDRLNNNFESIRMKDKLVNIAPDIKPDIKEVAELLKALTGEGSISGCKKRKDLEDLDIFAKLFMGSNGMPIVKATDHALERRIIFIEFTERFTDDNDVRTKRDKDKDIDLLDKLRPEKSGIFNRWYEGFKRIRDNKVFSLTDESRELTNAFRTENNKALAYYNDIFDNPEVTEKISNMKVGEYIIAMDYYGDKNSLNRTYTSSLKGKMFFPDSGYTFVSWCYDNGIENILAGNTFSKDFNSLFKEKHPEFKTGRKENRTALIKFTEVE